jgi:hypothetical protein
MSAMNEVCTLIMARSGWVHLRDEAVILYPIILVSCFLSGVARSVTGPGMRLFERLAEKTGPRV